MTPNDVAMSFWRYNDVIIASCWVAADSHQRHISDGQFINACMHQCTVLAHSYKLLDYINRCMWKCSYCGCSRWLTDCDFIKLFCSARISRCINWRKQRDKYVTYFLGEDIAVLIVSLVLVLSQAMGSTRDKYTLSRQFWRLRCGLFHKPLQNMP